MRASSYSDEIQYLYIEYFARPADPVGLTYWTEYLDAGGAWGDVTAGFSSAPESQALYGGLSHEGLVHTIYQKLFGRDAERSGLEYWIGRLDSGALNPAQAAYEMRKAALNLDAFAVLNKLRAAQAFTDGIDTPAEIAGYVGDAAAAQGRAYLLGVTGYESTLLTALDPVVLAGAIGLATGTYTQPPAAVPAPPFVPAPMPDPAPDAVASTVISLSMLSSTGAMNNTLNAGDTVLLGVTLSEAVQVNGVPQLALSVGGTPVQAQYVRGSGGSELVFSYTVQAGHNDADGISVEANSLSLNGGSIQDVSGNATVLTHGQIMPDARYKVDTTKPVAVLLGRVPVQLKEHGADRNPQVSALGNGGEFVVAWQGRDSTNDDSIFVQKFKADGALNGDRFQLEPLNKKDGNDEMPQISALGNAGEFVVTWQGQDSGGKFRIFVQKFDSNGPVHTDPVRLEMLRTTNEDKYPQISALGSAGEFVVTWQGLGTGTSSIFVQKFDTAGNPVSGGPVLLEAQLSKKSNESPQVSAVGSDGAFVVTWHGLETEAGGYDDYSIYVQKFHANGSKDGVMVRLEPNQRGTDRIPQVSALGSTGEFVVTWSGQDDGQHGDYSIYIEKFDKYGAPKGILAKLEPLLKTTGGDESPQVSALGSDGAFVVTWSGQDTDSPEDYSIFVQKFTKDGTKDGAMVQLEALDKTNGIDSNPQVSALGGDGAFVVTWMGQDSSVSSDTSIFVQKFDKHGAKVGTPVQLEAQGKTDGADEYPQVSALGSDGAFVVTWHGQDSAGGNSIYVQRFDTNGQPVLDSIATTATVASGAVVQVRSNEVGNAYLVHSSVLVNTVSDITSQADARWNQALVITANADTEMVTTGLDAGTYSLYVEDLAGNLSVSIVGSVVVV